MIQGLSEWLGVLWAYVNYVYVWLREGIRGEVYELDIMGIA